MKKYFPILLSKPGEMVALSHLSQNVKDEVTPVIEVLNESILDNSGNYSSRLRDTLVNIWSFDNNQVLLDFSFFQDIDNHIQSIQRLFDTLVDSGVNAVPVVKFNSSIRFVNLVRTLVATHSGAVCIRTNNDSGGFLNYNADVASLLIRVGGTEVSTSLLIDLGFADANTYRLLTTVAFQTIQSLYNVQAWNNVIVASGSFLTDLGGLTAPTSNISPSRLHRLPRYEWDIWTALQGQQLTRVVKYSDYGTKHPYYMPGGYEGSCSIKYTINGEYVIYRGRKASEHRDAGSQYNASAALLIASADYFGNHFSWGDNEIFAIGNRTDRPGNAGKWVQISQNHHITALHHLL